MNDPVGRTRRQLQCYYRCVVGELAPRDICPDCLLENCECDDAPEGGWDFQRWLEEEDELFDADELGIDPES